MTSPKEKAMNKHTPTPWELRGPEGTGWEIWAPVPWLDDATIINLAEAALATPIAEGDWDALDDVKSTARATLANTQ